MFKILKNRQHFGAMEAETIKNAVSPKNHKSRGNNTKKLLLFCTIFCVAFIAQGQTFDYDDIFGENQVEQAPAFPGGEFALQEFLKKNVRYPLSILDQEYIEEDRYPSIQVAFIVRADGKVTDVEIWYNVFDDIPNIPMREQIKRGIIRLIESMPKWNPGIKNGEYVGVFMMLDIHAVIIGG